MPVPNEELIGSLSCTTSSLDVLCRVAKRLAPKVVVDLDAVLALEKGAIEDEPCVVVPVMGEDLEVRFEVKPLDDYPLPKPLEEYGEDEPIPTYDGPREYYLHVYGCFAESVLVKSLELMFEVGRFLAEEALDVELSYGGDRQPETKNAVEALTELDELRSKLTAH